MSVNNQKPPFNPARLDVVDALRGFALFGIVLIHNIEHYNIFRLTNNILPALVTVDRWVNDTVFFIFAGKSYAIFTLLFGFSFYIQFRNREAQGDDFKWRFAWRMFLLFLFGIFHATFYAGDILVFYSVVGLILIPMRKVGNKAALITAAVLMLQPIEWGRIVYAFIDPEQVSWGRYFAPYYRLILPAITEGSLWDVMKANIWNGQLYSNFWQAENGRLFQTAALFLAGMLLGRTNMFVDSTKSRRFWKNILLWASVTFIPFFLLKTYIPPMITQRSLLLPLNIILPSYANFAFMAMLVSGFVLLWFGRSGMKFQRMFTPYGRMSLTNYIGQSLIGTFIYFGWGLSMYKYLGSTISMLVGVAIITLQLLFSRWWLLKHRQGPFEYLWRQGTWI
jgi:uncharacterized protein